MKQNHKQLNPLSTPLQAITSPWVSHTGMPALAKNLKSSPLRNLPSFIIYLPMLIQSVILGGRYRSLSLPTAVNPAISLGGLVDERKSDIFKILSPSLKKHILPYILIENTPETEKEIDRLLEKLKKKQIDFPFLAKPDISYAGWGIRTIRTREELKNYLKHFPKNTPLLLQKFSSYPAEFGIFYAKHPEAKKGWLFSITLKYLPYLRGDGKRSLRRLIQDDSHAGNIADIYFKRNQGQLEKIIDKDHMFRLCSIGSKSQGCICKNGNYLVDSELSNALDKISAGIKDFHFGRLDIKCGSLDDLKKLKNFDIIEINGAGSESTDIWDGNMGLFFAWKTLLRQNALLFTLGAACRKKGAQPSGIISVLRSWLNTRRRVKSYKHIPHTNQLARIAD